MNIGINLIPYSNYSGIEVYIKHILRQMIELEPYHNFFIFHTNSLNEHLYLEKQKNIEFINVGNYNKKYSKALFQQFQLYITLKKYNIDILFNPSPAAPIFYKNKVVVIHDCAYDRFKEFSTLATKIYFKIMFYGAKYFSKYIITVSDFSKKELIDLYGIPSQKIKVVHNGLPNIINTNDSIWEILSKKYKIQPKKYYIYVGNTRPRKNIQGMLYAFRKFSENNKDIKLVIAGKIDKTFIDIRNIINKLNIVDKVILTDFITDKEKYALYKNSIALLFPSFYEGFGIPILEAQSVGIPVITSKTSSMPEIAGQGALLVDPYDIENIYNAMINIYKNKDIRTALIIKGFENIKRFSWNNAAKKTIKYLSYAEE